MKKRNLIIYGDTPPPLAEPPFYAPDPAWNVPSDSECFSWWDRFDMPDNIRRHSLEVARVATFMARRAKELGLEVDVQAARASALLHDLAKAFTIRHGGNHSQLGAAWVMDLTRNPVLAQGVMHHVYWPFPVDVKKHFVPLAVLYGDKRVEHDKIVPMDERFEDLQVRYGATEEIRTKIQATLEQGLEIETDFSRFLEVDLSANSFDSGRLVQ